MRFRGMLVCAAAAAWFAGVALAQEMVDVRALAAKLATQEARLNDMERKAAHHAGIGAAGDVASIRKNAAVTVGGLLTTGYYFFNGKTTAKEFGRDISSTDPLSGSHRMRSLEISDAELYFQIDVNEHFDAFLSLDLHNGTDFEGYALAKSYYVRWKNICDSGFGLKVGRDRAVFGDSDNAVGYLDNWTAGYGDGAGWWPDTLDWQEGLARHIGWKYNGTTQITPYWEGLDGRLKVELSFMQNIWSEGWNGGAKMSGLTSSSMFTRTSSSGVRKVRSRNNGWGTLSGRIAYSPVEDLTFTASVINFHSNGQPYETQGNSLADSLLDQFHYKNSTAAALSVGWRPTFFSKLYVWSQWVHGWKVLNSNSIDSDAVNFGASYDIADSLTVFVQGDYLRSKGRTFKSQGWAAYAGAIYTLPRGVILEAGWRHEAIKYRTANNTGYAGELRGNTIYGNVGFEF